MHIDINVTSQAFSANQTAYFTSHDQSLVTLASKFFVWGSYWGKSNQAIPIS